MFRSKFAKFFAILALALVLCTAFVMNTPNASAHSTVQQQQTVQNVQQVAMNCTPYVSGNTIAWGYGGWLYLNDCALQTIASYGSHNITVGAAMVIGYRYPYATLFIGATYIYLGTMQWMSGQCQHRGAFLFRSAGIVFPAKVC